MKKLLLNNYEGYLVGGCVRDSILGLNAHDFDIVTNASPDEITSIFPNEKVDLVGKSFGVTLVNGIEVATYRHDIHGNNFWDVKYAETLEEDLHRRDLTINAMAQDINGNIIDNHNGLFDLEHKIIRFVGDGNKRIIEDPCRILRACRFLAKIGGRFARSTFKDLEHNAHLVKNVKPERIRLEIMKVMEIPNASRFFEALHEINILRDIFPSFERCWEHPHGNHHLESVSAHMLFSGDYVSTKYPLIKLAAYLHDCGKPESFDKVMKTFHKHEYIGANLASNELKKLKFTNKEINRVHGLIACHMQPGKNMSPKALRRFQKKLNDYGISIQDFFRMRMADRAGNVKCKTRKLSVWKDMIKKAMNPEVQETAFNVNDLAIRGKDLITEFNFNPGPIIGKIQREMLNYVIENGPTFNNKKSLIFIVNKYID